MTRIESCVFGYSVIEHHVTLTDHFFVIIGCRRDAVVFFTVTVVHEMGFLKDLLLVSGLRKILAGLGDLSKIGN